MTSYFIIQNSDFLLDLSSIFCYRIAVLEGNAARRDLPLGPWGVRRTERRVRRRMMPAEEVRAKES